MFESSVGEVLRRGEKPASELLGSKPFEIGLARHWIVLGQAMAGAVGDGAHVLGCAF